MDSSKVLSPLPNVAMRIRPLPNYLIDEVLNTKHFVSEHF